MKPKKIKAEYPEVKLWESMVTDKYYIQIQLSRGRSALTYLTPKEARLLSKRLTAALKGVKK